MSTRWSDWYWKGAGVFGAGYVPVGYETPWMARADSPTSWTPLDEPTQEESSVARAQATLGDSQQWGMTGVSLTGDDPAIVSSSTTTSTDSVGFGPDFKIDIPSGGIAAGSCIIVSSHLFTLRGDSTTACADDAGNTYVLVSQEAGPPNVTRVFVALNVLALAEGQNITLTFDSNSYGISHVTVINEFTGVSAIDKEVTNSDEGVMPYVLYGVLTDLPQLLVAAGTFWMVLGTTLVPDLNFIKCGDAASDDNRGWQQYRINEQSAGYVTEWANAGASGAQPWYELTWPSGYGGGGYGGGGYGGFTPSGWIEYDETGD